MMARVVMATSGLALALSACGRISDDPGGGAASGNGGTSSGAGSPSAGDGTGGEAGSPNAGSGAIAAQAGTAGSGDAGAAGEQPIDEVADYTHARWPMPSSVGSGLSNEADYDASEDGIVIDRITGLVWQRSIAALEVGSLTQADALAYCAALSLVGYSDWRLPTRIELVSLFASGPDWFNDNAAFPNLGGQFWSSSRGWLVAPQDLTIVLSAPDQKFDARCVRTGRSPKPMNAVRTADASIVIDRATRLTWQRNADFDEGTLAEAAAHCAALGLAGYGDWRLPSLPELATLVEDDRAYPAIDSLLFTGSDSSVARSQASADAPMSGEPRPVPIRFSDGQAAGSLWSGIYAARCVRQHR